MQTGKSEPNTLGERIHIEGGARKAGDPRGVGWVQVTSLYRVEGAEQWTSGFKIRSQPWQLRRAA